MDGTATEPQCSLLWRARLSYLGAVRGAVRGESVQQAQTALGVGVGQLAAGRVPGQAADSEALLMLLPAAGTTHTPQPTDSNPPASHQPAHEVLPFHAGLAAHVPHGHQTADGACRQEAAAGRPGHNVDGLQRQRPAGHNLHCAGFTHGLCFSFWIDFGISKNGCQAYNLSHFDTEYICHSHYCVYVQNKSLSEQRTPFVKKT